MKRWAIPAVCILLPALALGACGTKKVKGEEAAAQVESKFLQPKGITDATVKCPAETEAKEGATEKCTVTDKEGNKGTVTGTFDSDGNLGNFEGDVKKIQIAVIENKAEDEATNVENLSCAESTEPRAGANFTCFGTVKGSGLTQVSVRQTSEASEVDVKVRRKKLTTGKITKQIEKAAEKQIGQNVDVSCPKNVRFRVGATFSCKVTNPANGKSINLKYRQISETGKVVPVK